jgi:hypothetical protein
MKEKMREQMRRQPTVPQPQLERAPNVARLKGKVIRY